MSRPRHSATAPENWSCSGGSDSPPKLGGVPERKRGRGGSLSESVDLGTTPSSLTSFEASPYFLRLRAIALALRAGSRFAVLAGTPS